MEASFAEWFASYLNRDESEVRRLLNHKSALYFLMVWSIFESVCFDGYMTSDKISNYSDRVASHDSSVVHELTSIAKYFHERYQDKKLYGNLIHKKPLKDMACIIEKSFDDLKPSEIIFLLVTVVYRYRNNIFHGNKGVSSWLQFTEQIDKCRAVMQKLVDVSEKRLE